MFGRSPISISLDQNVQNKTVLIDRAPGPMLLAPHRDHYFVEMPLISKLTCRSAANVGGKMVSTLLNPCSNCLMRHGDAALSQLILDHPQIDRKPEIQPDRPGDHTPRKSVTVIEGQNIRIDHVPPSHINAAGASTLRCLVIYSAPKNSH